MAPTTAQDPTRTREPRIFREARKLLLALPLLLASLHLQPPVAEAAPSAIADVVSAEESAPSPADTQQRQGITTLEVPVATIARLPGCDLQFGATGELLPTPLGVRIPAGTRVHFQATEMGQFFESGCSDAWITAGANGLAQVHFQLGENPGRYIVLVTREGYRQADLSFELRALSQREAEAMQAERRDLELPDRAKGAGR
jgi:hypothetical protein